MREAMHYVKKEKDAVQCRLCPRNCLIVPDGSGVCKARKNIGGVLFSMVFARPVATNIDPIEKKPLFHFHPGKDVFSIGTVGCNLLCQHCQNWQIARATPKDTDTLHPEDVVKLAMDNGCDMIAYTYTEPTIFYEYVYETAKLAKQQGLKNVIVSNGYINKGPLEELIPYLDAANIDLKGFSEESMKRMCFATLKPVLETLKTLVKTDVWLEVTNLIVPGENDRPEDIDKMCRWIKDNLGKDVPLHFSRFFPHHKMKDHPPTPVQTMLDAAEIGGKHLDFVYIGNMASDSGENTYCPRCDKLLLGRSGFGILVNKLKAGKCPCGQDIAGRW